MDDQLAEVRKQLRLQLTRTGQLQAELDRHRRETIEVQEQLSQMQATLKQILATTG